jgi:4-amino-4-deoxy-L-arabinose transferase-like glycosyltransferase
VVRYRLRDMPLERDEGEYAYSGQLLLQGIPPYQLAYNMKLPGIYAAYAAIMEIFGETPPGIHLGLLVVNEATLLLLYVLTARILGRLAGVVSACSWAVLSTSTSVMGFEAHATNFVALPVVLGIMAMVWALNRDSWVLLLVSGLWCGISVLMKQHGVFFVLFCLLYLLWTSRGKNEIAGAFQRCLIFSVGAVLPYGVTCVALYKANVFPQFWFWTVSYAGEYSKIDLRTAIKAFLGNFSLVVAPALPIWILAASGLAAVWWERNSRRHTAFVVLLLIYSFLSVCPGGYFRQHYFILILPAIAILAGLSVSAATQRLEESCAARPLRYVPVLIFVMCMGAVIWHQRSTYFRRDPLAVFETAYGTPFVGAIKVADYVKQHTSPADRIAALGSEPEIYFYARRHSATGYIYMYSLVEKQKYTSKVRAEFLRELATSKPLYLVYVDVWGYWGERNLAQAEPFLAEFKMYMDQEYEPQGVADMGESPHYVWGEAARDYRPQAAKVIWVLRRKAEVNVP